jgi:hypothetical protein
MVTSKKYGPKIFVFAEIPKKRHNFVFHSNRFSSLRLIAQTPSFDYFVCLLQELEIHMLSEY